MTKRVTLRDVAKAAGVHVSTVSRALDPNSKTSLTPEVSDRIAATVQALGYRPNRMAASLRTSRSMSVGVMIPDITNTIFPPIIRGIESVLEPRGYATVLVNTDNLPERELRLMEVLRQRGVDGIISVVAHLDDPSVSDAASSGVPVVTLNRRLQRSPVPFVVHDEDDGVKAVLEHLISLGHSRIAHIAGPLYLSTGQARLDAYRRNCRAMGLVSRSEVVIFASRYSEEEGRRCARQLLQERPDITALVCANDRVAIGAYAGVQELGMSVPQDVSIVGFNDSPMLEFFRPALTTVRIQQFEAGRASAQLLLDSIDGKLTGPVGYVLPVELIVRNSTAPPRTVSRQN